MIDMQTILLWKVSTLSNYDKKLKSVSFIQPTVVEHLLCVRHCFKYLLFIQ